jgi:hypothetical protein
MPKYVIERTIPGAGKLSPEAIHDVSAKSNTVLRELRSEGQEVEWVESYVTPDKLYCVYTAPSEQAIREHAKRGGFPADRISEVKEVIDPTTGE